jgi:hypothetical protein
MLGQGMPWHIIMVFFFIGVLVGVNNGKKKVPGIGAEPSQKTNT